jgi:alpha-N-arabinofuranosidase
MVLTEGDKMLLTPTYHVFDMYAPHHDATCLPCFVDAGSLGEGDTAVPSLSASRAGDGSVHVTMTNLSASKAVPVAVALHGLDVSSLQAQVLTGDAMNSHNTFAASDTVQPVELDGLRPTKRGFDLELPPRSVVAVNAR